MNTSHLIRAVFFLLSLIGVYGAGNLSLLQLQVGEACPTFGPMPICYLVLLAYLLVSGSVFIARKPARLVFFCGWVPIFLLGLTGTILQITVGDTCPVDKNGIAQCYLSLSLAVLLLVLFLWSDRLRSR